MATNNHQMHGIEQRRRLFHQVLGPPSLITTPSDMIDSVTNDDPAYISLSSPLQRIHAAPSPLPQLVLSHDPQLSPVHGGGERYYRPLLHDWPRLLLSGNGSISWRAAGVGPTHPPRAAEANASHENGETAERGVQGNIMDDKAIVHAESRELKSTAKDEEDASDIPVSAVDTIDAKDDFDHDSSAALARHSRGRKRRRGGRARTVTQRPVAVEPAQSSDDAMPLELPEDGSPLLENGASTAQGGQRLLLKGFSDFLEDSTDISTHKPGLMRIAAPSPPSAECAAPTLPSAECVSAKSDYERWCAFVDAGGLAAALRACQELADSDHNSAFGRGLLGGRPNAGVDAMDDTRTQRQAPKKTSRFTKRRVGGRGVRRVNAAMLRLQLRAAVVDAVSERVQAALWHEERQRAESKAARMVSDFTEYAQGSVDEFEALCEEELQELLWTEIMYWDEEAADGTGMPPGREGKFALKSYLRVMKAQLKRLFRGNQGALAQKARDCVEESKRCTALIAKAYRKRLERAVGRAVEGSGTAGVWERAGARWITSAAALHYEAVETALAQKGKGERRKTSDDIEVSISMMDEEDDEEELSQSAARATTTQETHDDTAHSPSDESVETQEKPLRWVSSLNRRLILQCTQEAQDFREWCTHFPSCDDVLEALEEMPPQTAERFINEGMDLLREHTQGLAWKQALIAVFESSPLEIVEQANKRATPPDTTEPKEPRGLPVLAPKSSCFSYNPSLISQASTFTASAYPAAVAPLSPSLTAVLLPAHLHMPNLSNAFPVGVPNSTQPRLVHRSQSRVNTPVQAPLEAPAGATSVPLLVIPSAGVASPLLASQSRLLPPLLQPWGRQLSITLPAPAAAGSPAVTASPVQPLEPASARLALSEADFSSSIRSTDGALSPSRPAASSLRTPTTKTPSESTASDALQPPQLVASPCKPSLPPISVWPSQPSAQASVPVTPHRKLDDKASPSASESVPESSSPSFPPERLPSGPLLPTSPSRMPSSLAALSGDKLDEGIASQDRPEKTPSPTKAAETEPQTISVPSGDSTSAQPAPSTESSIFASSTYPPTLSAPATSPPPVSLSPVAPASHKPPTTRISTIYRQFPARDADTEVCVEELQQRVAAAVKRESERVGARMMAQVVEASEVLDEECERCNGLQQRQVRSAVVAMRRRVAMREILKRFMRVDM